MVGKIRFENVSKTFIRPDGETVQALNNIELNINQGDFVCLIGPSGCGKSTMLRLLAGLDNPTGGAVYLDEEKVTKPSCDRGLVFQDHNLFPWLTIYDNVAFGLKVRKLFKEKKESVEEFIKLVGLDGFERSYPHQLSGGMCQRASLARALIGHPKALLLSMGMCVDFAIHDNGDGNPHVHILLTTRKIGENGFTQKERTWNDKSLLLEWRKLWADWCNHKLYFVSKERIDHRSYAAQGIDKLPQKHLGAAACAIEKKDTVLIKAVITVG